MLWFWPTVQRRGTSHPAHDHPASLASGTIYLLAPPDSGRILFLDPRRDVPSAWSEGDTKTEPERDAAAFEARVSVRPEPGMLLLFPPWLRHAVEPSDNSEPRVALSFNAVGSWAPLGRASATVGRV